MSISYQHIISEYRINTLYEHDYIIPLYCYVKRVVLTSISSECMRTSLATRVLFIVLVLYIKSPFFRCPWYILIYVSWPNFPKLWQS